MATVFTDKGPALSGNKTATFRADEAKAVAGVPQGTTRAAPTSCSPRTCRGSIPPTA